MNPRFFLPPTVTTLSALLFFPAFVSAEEAIADSPPLTATALQPAATRTMAVPTFLQPYRSIDISAVESGVIGEILVEEGDRVEAGQVLLKLDTAVTEARLAIAKARAENTGRIIAAESQYQHDKERYEKLRSLGGNSSEYELKQALSAMQSSGGLYTEALEEQNINKLTIPQIEAELDRRILNSPIEGTVVEIVKDLAEAVSPADSRRDEYLVRVVETARLRAVAHLPADSARDLEKGGTLRFEVNQGPNRPPLQVEGALEYVSPVIDSASNTLRVRLVVDNREQQIRPGSSANLLIPAAKIP